MERQVAGVAFSLLVVAATTIPAFAQEPNSGSYYGGSGHGGSGYGEGRQSQSSGRPLQGLVDYTEAAPVLRISRQRAQAATMDNQGQGAPLSGFANENGGLQELQASFAPMPQTPRQPIQGRAGLLNGNAIRNSEPPYRWQQSRDGGYYDETGTIKEVVPGTELWKYGGRFANGTPVPRRMVMPSNFASHVWQPGTTNVQWRWQR